jgi:hypothetical protein
VAAERRATGAGRAAGRVVVRGTARPAGRGEWGLGSLAVAAEQVARDLVVDAVAASEGLPGQPVVQLWLRGDGRRMLLAVWDGCPLPPVRVAAVQWPFGGIAVEGGWYEHEGGKTCWSLLSWRDAHPEVAAGQPS